MVGWKPAKDADVDAYNRELSAEPVDLATSPRVEPLPGMCEAGPETRRLALGCVQLDIRPIPDRKGLQATILLNRARQLNALSWELIREFADCVAEVQGDARIRVLFVTGAGRAFSAGGDLKSYIALQRDPVAFPKFVADLQHAFGQLRQLRVPVIALVNGITAAGGLELLLNCDVAIAARSARIGDGHLNVGQMGGGGVLTLLPRVIGLARAMELLFTGKYLSAEQAAQWGLVSDVVPDELLTATGLEIARQIAMKSPLAVANAKSVMYSIWSEAMSTTTGLRLERDQNSFYCLTSHDAAEGLEAFRDKRPSSFLGR
jgi:enoyl-CoA hydratase/carnithine racemase